MKLQSLLFVCFLGFLSSTFAANHHTYPKLTSKENSSAAHQKWISHCDIEVINHSYENVKVFGVFDDGTPLDPFIIYSFESPHYISLYYFGYCHSGMDLYVNTIHGENVYAGYIRANSTLRIFPAFANQLKTEIKAK